MTKTMDTAELIEAMEAQRLQDSRSRIAGGAGHRRFSSRLLEASRPTASEEASRAKLKVLLGTFWDDAEACGARHVVKMIAAAVDHEINTWHRAAEPQT